MKTVRPASAQGDGYRESFGIMLQRLYVLEELLVCDEVESERLGYARRCGLARDEDPEEQQWLY